MKKLLNYLTILSFLSIVVLISCGGGGDDGPTDPVKTPEQLQAEKIVGKTWKATGTNAGVTLDGVAAPAWAGFTLNFTGNENGGNFTTTNSQSPLVWPATGTWRFQNGVTTVLRSDGVQMTLNVTDTELTLSFTIVDPSGRVEGVGGAYVFRIIP